MTQIKKGDFYRLPCGHIGKVFMVLSNAIVVKVLLRKGYCDRCSRVRNKHRYPIAFIISLKDTKDPTLSKG